WAGPSFFMSARSRRFSFRRCAAIHASACMACFSIRGVHLIALDRGGPTATPIARAPSRACCLDADTSNVPDLVHATAYENFRANVRDKHFEYIPAFVPKDAGGVQPLDPPACDVVRGNQAIDVLG